MARNVADLALLFDAMVGAEAGDPLSLPREDVSYLAASQSGWKPRRVAVSRDLGISPVDPEIAEMVLAAARKLEAEGVIVEEAHPDLSEAMNCFQTLRAIGYATGMRQLLLEHRDKLKPEVIWNIEEGLKQRFVGHISRTQLIVDHLDAKIFKVQRHGPQAFLARHLQHRALASA